MNETRSRDSCVQVVVVPRHARRPAGSSPRAPASRIASVRSSSSFRRALRSRLRGRDSPDKQGGASLRGEVAGREAPRRIVVHYLEHGCPEYLRAGGGGEPATTARWATRAEAAADRACDEVGGALRLLCALPGAALRGTLAALRALLTGSVATLSDALLKPALAGVYNGAVHPPIVVLGGAMRAVREALRPVWLVAGDAAAVLATLLAACRPLAR